MSLYSDQTKSPIKLLIHSVLTHKYWALQTTLTLLEEQHLSMEDQVQQRIPS